MKNLKSIFIVTTLLATNLHNSFAEYFVGGSINIEGNSYSKNGAVASKSRIGKYAKLPSHFAIVDDIIKWQSGIIGEENSTNHLSTALDAISSTIDNQINFVEFMRENGNVSPDDNEIIVMQGLSYQIIYASIPQNDKPKDDSGNLLNNYSTFEVYYNALAGGGQAGKANFIKQLFEKSSLFEKVNIGNQDRFYLKPLSSADKTLLLEAFIDIGILNIGENISALDTLTGFIDNYQTPSAEEITKIEFDYNSYQELTSIKDSASKTTASVSILAGYRKKINKFILKGEGSLDLGLSTIGNNSANELEVSHNVTLNLVGSVGYQFVKKTNAYVNFGLSFRKYDIKYRGQHNTIDESNFATHALIGVGYERAINRRLGLFTEFNHLIPISNMQTDAGKVKVSTNAFKIGFRYYYK
jgi:hypothetical protein